MVAPAPGRSPAQAIVELALILPLVLLLLVGSLDLGRAFVYGIAVQSGAGAAVRYGAVQYSDPGVTNDRIYKRLIDASSPALVGCAYPTGSGTSMTCTDSTGASWTLSVTYSPSQAAGNSIEVKAVGSVGVFPGVSTSLVNLPLIDVQGDAQGVLL